MTPRAGLWRTMFMATLLGACAPDGTLVTAAEGGTVTSDDGAFVLVLAPGALTEDTRVSIRALPAAEWPTTTGRAAPLGGVYRVDPSDLILEQDSWAAFVFETAPDALVAADGSDVIASGYVNTEDDGSSPAPATRTTHLADGRTAIVATVFELGTYWVSDTTVYTDGTVRSLHLSARVDAEAGPHPVGEEWRVSGVQLASDGTLPVVRRSTWTTVTSAGASPFVGVVGDVSPRTWDATFDPTLGLHPFELFGIEPDGRSETVGGVVDMVPVTLEPDAPLSPVTTPLPGFRCAAAGSSGDVLFVGVDAVSGASSGTVSLGVARELGSPSCN